MWNGCIAPVYILTNVIVRLMKEHFPVFLHIIYYLYWTLVSGQSFMICLIMKFKDTFVGFLIIMSYICIIFIKLISATTSPPPSD